MQARSPDGELQTGQPALNIDEVEMSLQVIKEAIANKKMICPQCKQPIQKFEKYAETIDAVRDGFGTTDIDSRGSRVTLTCGNGECPFHERTEFWSQYIDQ